MNIRQEQEPEVMRSHDVAILVEDSWNRPDSGGRRGDQETPRQLIFQTQTMDIALSVIHSRFGTWSVAGQIFVNAGDSQGFEAELVQEQTKIEDTRHVAHVDEVGEFWLNHLRSGGYHLVVRRGDMGVLVTPVDLYERAA